MHLSQGIAYEAFLSGAWDSPDKMDKAVDDFLTAALKGAPVRDLPVVPSGTPQWDWRALAALDSTQLLHEQTLDLLADRDLPWAAKRSKLGYATRKYKERLCVSCSSAPMEMTLRRTGVLLKPYYGWFRTNYPRTAGWFNMTRWYRGAVYEAMLSGDGQDRDVEAVDSRLFVALHDRPMRVLLGREVSPRWSRLSPEESNILDNEALLQDVLLDLLTYPEWSPEQKRRELRRVLDALAGKDGDSGLARKFEARTGAPAGAYPDWMRAPGGEAERIALEALSDALPTLAPGLKAEDRLKLMAQARLKLAPGLDEGEVPGSLLDALKVQPGLRIPEGMVDPGVEAPALTEGLARMWLHDSAALPEAEPLVMKEEFKAPVPNITLTSRP